jgi:hypothetical protein
MRRRLVLLLAGGAVAGLALFRRSGALPERVDLFYEDGSHVTLLDGDAKPLLEIARSVL